MQQRPQLNRPTAFKVGKHTFVSGLHWALLASKLKRSDALKKEADEIRRLGGPNFEVAVVRKNSGLGGTAQAGFSARSGNIRPGAYSAAAVVADALGHDFVAAIPLEGRGRQLVLVAARNGAILPMQDALLGFEEAKQRFLELISAMADDEIRIVCPDSFAVPDSEEWTFDKIIAAASKPKLSASCRLGALTPAMAIRDRMPVILIGLVVLGGMYGWTEYEDYIEKKERDRRAALARAEAEKLRKAQEVAAQPIREIRRPWVIQPLPGEFLDLCGRVMYALPLALDGWEFTSASCDGKSVTATYSRISGATVDMGSTSAALFGLPAPSFDDPGNLATITISLPELRPGGEDPIAPRTEIRNRFISLAQGVGANFTLSDIPDPPPPRVDVLPGQQPPPPPPPPPWKSMRFEFRSDERIEQAIPALFSMPGVRLTNITITRSGSSLSYSTAGELHAQR